MVPFYINFQWISWTTGVEATALQYSRKFEDLTGQSNIDSTSMYFEVEDEMKSLC